MTLVKECRASDTVSKTTPHGSYRNRFGRSRQVESENRRHRRDLDSGGVFGVVLYSTLN